MLDTDGVTCLGMRRPTGVGGQRAVLSRSGRRVQSEIKEAERVLGGWGGGRQEARGGERAGSGGQEGA